MALMITCGLFRNKCSNNLSTNQGKRSHSWCFLYEFCCVFSRCWPSVHQPFKASYRTWSTLFHLPVLSRIVFPNPTEKGGSPNTFASFHVKKQNSLRSCITMQKKPHEKSQRVPVDTQREIHQSSSLNRRPRTPSPDLPESPRAPSEP